MRGDPAMWREVFKRDGETCRYRGESLSIRIKGTGPCT
jgi:hypothetical protein